MRVLLRSAVILLSLLCVLPSHAAVDAVLATDNFTRADNADLGTAWDPNQNTFKILTNTARTAATGSDSSERNNSVTWPVNQYSKVTIGVVSTSGTGTGYGPACRMDTGGGNNIYRLIVSSTGFELGRYNNPTTFTSILLSTGTTFANGDVVELRCVGTTTVLFTMLKNGVEFSAGQSDSSGSKITTGAPGVAYSATALTTNTITAWEGGAVLSPGRSGFVQFE